MSEAYNDLLNKLEAMKAEVAAMESHAEEEKKRERVNMAVIIRKAIMTFGFTTDDFTVPSPKQSKTTKPYVSRNSKSPNRFVNLTDAACKWTGKGKSPSWLPECDEDREPYKIENALAKLIAYPQPYSEVIKKEIELMQYHIEWAKQIDAEKAAKAAAKAESEGKKAKNKEGKSKSENTRIDLTEIPYGTAPVATSFVAETPVPSNLQVMGVPSSTGYAA